MRIALVLALVSLPVAAQAQQTLTLEIRDYATLPDHGSADWQDSPTRCCSRG